ncbi:MAG: S8/S53 family peptidase [Acidobacteriota bacterium]|nr:S8/S53 family peptidase [Acidobacteriota bacterium]
MISVVRVPRQSSRLAIVFAVLLGLLALAGPAMATDVVRWYRFDGCDPSTSAFSSQQQTPETFACGSLGVYYVGDQGLSYTSACLHQVHGEEAPALYLAQHNPRFMPSAGEWFPCRQGNCFGRRSQPWAAVIDWNQGHGWSVAGTLSAVAGSGLDLMLYPLDAGGSTFDTKGASDLDVLVQLCAVAEYVHQNPSDPPLVVNMSFGRLYDSGISSLFQSRGQVALQDEIHTVLGHLQSQLGIHLVAAAGNHGRLLFPASDSYVMAVGGMDIEEYVDAGTVSKALQAPTAAQALLPAYGLYLKEGTASTYWPVPPGSSYASAFASGWLGGFMADQSLRPSNISLTPSSTLEPVKVSTDYLLVLDSQTLSGSDLPGAAEVAAPVLEHVSSVCNASTLTTVTTSVSSVTPSLPTSSSADLAGSNNLPLPNTRPCVPCHGYQDTPGLRIKLPESEGFPSGQTLAALLLRVGSSYYEITDTSVISDFEDGLIDELLLTGVGSISTGTSVELVYELSLTSYGSFWDSTPVHMHN